MEKPEIEELIAKRVAEAKLDVAEKRLQFVLKFGGALGGGLLVIFGVLIPIIMTERSSSRLDKAIQGMENSVQEMKKDYKEYMQMAASQNTFSMSRLDKEIEGIKTDFRDLTQNQKETTNSSVAKIDNAIKDMQDKFDELSGLQLRKPELECFVNGAKLDGSKIHLKTENSSQAFEIRNTGDAVARNVRLRLYLDKEPGWVGNIQENGGWYSEWIKTKSDELDFQYAYEPSDGYNSVDPKDSKIFLFGISSKDKTILQYQALLKIFYEQKEPKKYVFTIAIQ
jgi:gas vesicle protein